MWVMKGVRMQKLREKITIYIIALALCFSFLALGASPASFALTGGAGGYVCGFDEEHTHTESCFKNVLVCGKEEHVPLCGMEEHLHDLNCCEAQSVLVCSLPEHSHTEYCFDVAGNLVCGLPEHIHSFECYQSEFVLTCSKTEHTHTETCIPYDANGMPYEIHTHTSACWQRQCVCGKQEHKHDRNLCMFKSLEGLENEAIWEQTIPFDRLTGNWGQDILTVAESQVGYTENYYNAVIGEDGKTSLGYTRYGHWYGYPYGDWCAMFASFCMHYAGIPNEVIPFASGVETWIQLLEQRGMFISAQNYVPSPGDLVFIADNGVRPNHMGIAASYTVNDNPQSGTLGVVRIIQGNKDDAVRYVDIAVPNYSIVGYVSVADIYNIWLNMHKFNIKCGSDELCLSYDFNSAAPSIGSIVAIQSSESSQVYHQGMKLAYNYMSMFNSDPSKLSITIYEVVGENGGFISELPQPSDIQYVGGEGTEPVTASFSVNGRLVLMICR